MMLSVVVSTRGDDRATVATLAALIPGATAGLVADVLLLDRAGSDAIKMIADASGCELLVHLPQSDGTPDNGLMLAAKRTRSPWLLFLQAGAVLQSGWIEEIIEFIEQSSMRPQARGAVFRSTGAHYGDGRRPKLAKTVWRWLPGGSPDKGLLISRSHYERLGGHPAAAKRPEARLLWRLGRRARVKLHSGIVTS